MRSYRHKWCWTLKLPKFSSCTGKHQKIPQTWKLKLHELTEELKISEGSFFHYFAWTFVNEKAVFKLGFYVCSLSIKNNNESTIQSVVCNCFYATKRSFCVNTWQQMKHRFPTSLQSQIGCHFSGQPQVKAVQNDQRRKHQQEKFCHPYFGMRWVFCSSITLRKEKPSIANIIEYYWFVWRKKSQKNSHKWRRKNCSFTRTMHRITSRLQWWQTTSIAFRIASASILFSKSGPQWLLAIWRPQKNASEK